MDSYPEWFVVIKYTDQDYLGESVDAFYVENSCEALHRVSLGPMRVGDKLRGYWVTSTKQRKFAIAMHERKRREERDWMRYCNQLEDHFALMQERKIDIG